MKARDQAIQEWNSLKGKIQNSIETAWKDTAPNQFATNQEFERERTAFNKLEQKLEKVRNLVADGNFNRLKQMVKSGKI